MKKFINDNPVIVLGLVLPLAIVIIFLLAINLYESRMPAPEYDIIYAKNYFETTF